MMKTKIKIEKKNKVAPDLGPFKQALAVRLNPEFLPSVPRGHGKGQNLAAIR
jgi:hypothetical protein